MTSPSILSRVGRAAIQAAAAMHERNDAIRAAAPHHTLAEIAKAAGLTRARIHQIIHTKEESR